MVSNENKPFRRFFLALVAGALLGIVAGVAIRMQRPGASDAGRTGESPSNLKDPDAADSSVPASERDSAAWQYAMACRDGDWERVVAMTLWMQDRLAFTRETDGPDAVADEKGRLIESLSTRTLADNRLQKAGVEDPYVFSPGAEIEFESVDSGREDLELPVARRTWLRVVYPAREKSLLDSENIPIRSLRVGVNVSGDGLVLKANVIGNLDIDLDSVAYDWPSE